MIYRWISLNQWSEILGQEKFHTRFWNNRGKKCNSSITNILQKKKKKEKCEFEFEPCKITMAQPVWQDLCSSADFSIRTQIFICSLWQTNNFLPCFRPLCTPSSSVAWLRLTVFSKKTTLSTSFRQQPDDRSEETKIENLVRQS